MKDNKLVTLGIETSCDETSAAVMLEGREVLSNVIASQIKILQAFGGVVPEIASRHHLNNINPVIDSALKEADITLRDVDIIGVTSGPGLVGALLIGLATAKSMAYVLKKPLIGVHHIQGHISAIYIDHKELEPPFLALVVSGGHTSLVDVTGYNNYTVLGSTRDDAAGEAFDKVARVLGLGYPGGPLIDEAAKKGDPHAVEFKRVFLEKGSLDFSFSGTKTGVLNYLNTQKLKGNQIKVNDVAASFQQSVIEVLVGKTIMAAERTNRDKIIIAGGVAANSLLRQMMQNECDQKGFDLYLPSTILCTDNAAMIGCAAYYKYKSGQEDNLFLDAHANMAL